VYTLTTPKFETTPSKRVTHPTIKAPKNILQTVERIHNETNRRDLCQDPAPKKDKATNPLKRKQYTHQPKS